MLMIYIATRAQDYACDPHQSLQCDALLYFLTWMKDVLGDLPHFIDS